MNNSSEFCQDLIRQFDEIDASYSNETMSDVLIHPVNQNYDIDSFLYKFNGLYMTTCTSLNSVIDYLTKNDPKASSNEMKNMTLISENNELKNEIEHLKARCKSLQSKNEKYESALFKFHRKISDETIKNETLSTQIIELKTKIETLNNAAPQIIEQKIDFEGVFQKIKQMYKSNKKENQTLINIVQRQNMIIQKYDQIVENDMKIIQSKDSICISHNGKQTNNNNNLNHHKIEPITDEIDELYTVLGAITKLSLDHAENAKQISEDSSSPIRDRIIKIFRKVIENNNKLDDKKITNNFIKEDSEVINEAQKRSLRILAVMDEELNFLQQLAKNSELQSIVFPNETKISISFKQQLIEHCTKLGEFIEKTLPRVSLNCEIDKLPHMNCFDVLNPPDIHEKVAHVYENIKSEDSREVFQLFVSEVIVSSILQKYSMECQLRLENTRKKMNEMQNAVDKTIGLKKEIKYYQDREKKMRQMLDSIFDTNPKTDFLVVFDAVLKYFQNQGENLPIISDLKTALSQTTREHSKELRDIKKKHKREIRLLQKKCNEFLKQIEVTKIEKSELQKQIEEYKTKISVSENQVRDVELFYKEKINQHSSEYETQVQELNSSIDKLRNILNEKDNKIIDLNNTVSSLKTEIMDHKKKNNELKLIAQESRNLVMTKTAELKSSYERTITTLAGKIESNASLENDYKNLTIKASNLTTENEKLRLENKTMSMQIKTSEEKWKNEKEILASQLSTQIKSAKSTYSSALSQISSYIKEFAFNFGIIENRSVALDVKDIPNLFDSISAKFQNEVKQNLSYSKFYQAMTKFESLIDIKSPENAINSIQSLIDLNESLQEQITQLQTKIQQEYAYIQRMRQHDDENTEKLVELKQWEIWAKRQIKGKIQNPEIPFDHIRRIIEEELWNTNNTLLYNNVDSENNTPVSSQQSSPIIKMKNNFANKNATLLRPRTLLPGIPPSE
ncbi:hypothetical protein TRFO_20353 [Tritrichomonas foetus]|uniref:Uncharacterized protein n=1 Tax=Tritrichomonas foetus TaxID=1144522 RepID=A0A1J4KG50_9EUKA|nr:hypothetical protein TRFO_20353 [Tritrichomonas foetus]|eukprot:OHT10391.1 hypothetical protein TRFO_20353 [Tritrichomonas foetus]